METTTTTTAPGTPGASTSAGATTRTATEDNFDYLFKVVVIGDMGVGKTAVVQRFKTGTFIERQGTTIGVDFTMRTLIVDGKRVKLQIWDTGGQERFRTITQSYYRSAQAVILCYDLTCEQSFESLPRWIDDTARFAAPNVIRLLIATKADMAETSRLVETEEGEQLARAHFMLDFVETSAKDNTNVETAFTRLAEALVRQADALGASGAWREGADDENGNFGGNTTGIGGRFTLDAARFATNATNSFRDSCCRYY